MDRRLVLAGSLLLLAGCAAGPRPAVAPAATPLEELEPLYSAVAGREALVIRVASNGCTAKEDFTFFVERKGAAATLAFGRRRLDRCRSFAIGQAELSFPYGELGVQRGAPLFLLNPLLAWTGPGS